MKKSKIYWRKLDDQAKVFSLAVNKKDTSIFRVSVVLKEKIEAKILQKAVELALEKYKAFKVKMRSGIFWYYLYENKKKPIISIEKEYPFKKLNTKENNDYLFKVTYFDNKINIEFFHALTDGNGGEEFLKEVVCRYLDLKHPSKLDISKVSNAKIIQDTENAYKRNYKKNINRKSIFSQKAYMLKGEELEKGKIGINHFSINLNELKACVKSKDCTLSVYLIAMITYSIYEANYRKYEGKDPITICVPINLKKYFPSETISNFVSYMMVRIKVKNNKVYSFENILDIVKKEFDKKLKIDKILETMSSDGKMINNFFVRIVPLVLKRIMVNVGSLRLKRNFTLTFSNIGKFEIEEKYKKYIENVFLILSPDWAEKIRCGICSYENNLVVTFGTKLKDNSIETKFKDCLKENNIDFKIEGNGVNVIS